MQQAGGAEDVLGHSDMKKPGLFRTRILISVAIGFLVAVIACIAAWLPMRWMPNFGPKVMSTLYAFSDIEVMIRQYQSDTNSLPQSLAELRPFDKPYYRCNWDLNSNPLDAWGRPIIYSVDGTQFTLSSFGRDGKPGGVGLDADLPDPQAEPDYFVVPFHQFIFHKPARGVVGTCLVSGLVVFFIGMITIDPSGLTSKRVVPLVVTLAVTVIGAVIASFFIAALHIPNHH
jgi:hypothetical protein